MYKGNKIHIFLAVFPELLQTVTEWIYIVVFAINERPSEGYFERLTAQHI